MLFRSRHEQFKPDGRRKPGQHQPHRTGMYGCLLYTSTKLFQYAGASRFAYNWALAREIENYEKGGKFLSDAELRKEFTKLRHSDEYTWLLNISNNVTKQAIKDACTAYKNFFRGLQKFPRFKSKKRSMPKFYQDNVKIRFSNTHVKFEGFSSSRKANKQKMNWVRLAEHGRIPTNAKYMNPRISFDGLNWWISVCVEFPGCRETLNDDGVGIDLGIKDLAVCSDGTKYKNCLLYTSILEREQITDWFDNNKMPVLLHQTPTLLNRQTEYEQQSLFS